MAKGVLARWNICRTEDIGAIIFALVENDWLQKQPPIGSGTPYYDGDTLKIKGTFASTDRAQEVRQLVTDGHIKAMSAGYLRLMMLGLVGWIAIYGWLASVYMGVVVETAGGSDDLPGTAETSAEAEHRLYMAASRAAISSATVNTWSISCTEMKITPLLSAIA